MSSAPSSSSSAMNIEIPKKPPHKTASEHRRATKPIMEKRRRARINHSLNELKSLILDALNKDPSRHSKLEKADILEMTVRHLQNMQRQQMALEIARDPSVMNKYRAGFSECATEVGRYVTKIDGVDHSMRQRLLNHLSTCVDSLNTSSINMGQTQSGSSSSSSSYPQLQIQIPFHASLQRSSVSSMSSSSTASSSMISHPVNLSTASSDINNNHRIRSSGPPDAKIMRLTPPSSASSNFSFFPASSPAPTTPSTPGTSGSSSSYAFYTSSSAASHNNHNQSGHHHPILPEFMFTSASHPWPSRQALGSVSPGSSSSLGSLSPGSDFSIDATSSSASHHNSVIVSTGIKRDSSCLSTAGSVSSAAGSDVWRPW